MSEENNGPIGKFFEGYDGRDREHKVLRYMSHRLQEGAHLDDVKHEEYVQRNVTSTELNRICRDPRLIHASREGMEKDFEENPGPAR